MKPYVLWLILLAAACAPRSASTPFNATSPAQTAVPLDTDVRILHTVVPMVQPRSTRTWEAAPSAAPSTAPSAEPDQPTPTLTLAPTFTLTPSLVPTSTFIPSPTRGTPPAAGTSIPTWTPPPPDPSSEIADHYVFARPISPNNEDWIARTYPYGGTQNGRLQVHHGVDLVNPTGVAIYAAADGTVVYAGDDLTQQFGSMNDYYGMLVVLQHDFLSPQGEPVFTLYGHMTTPTVRTGQRVSEGDRIGIVGSTGVALGPHLHFEVRIGDPYSFDATRNPELWMRPFAGEGTLVGRVTDANGTPLFGVTVDVKAGSFTRETYTYGDASVNPDPSFGENFTIGDLPANYYNVIVNDTQYGHFQRLIYVYPNRSTWLDIRLNR